MSHRAIKTDLHCARTFLSAYNLPLTISPTSLTLNPTAQWPWELAQEKQMGDNEAGEGRVAGAAWCHATNTSTTCLCHSL